MKKIIFTLALGMLTGFAFPQISQAEMNKYTLRCKYIKNIVKD
jgi:hypothetical protein